VSPAAVPVVCYHSVTTESVAGFEPWEVTPAVFAAQIGHLVDSGYTVIPLEQYVRWLRGPLESPLPAKPVVLTFDDGYVNFANALEVLTRHQVPSTMYVPTEYVGAKSSWLSSSPLCDMPIMSWSQLEEIRDAGVEVGAHAHVHRPLDELSAKQVREDVRRAKQTLEDALGVEVRSFAYPHGYHGPTVRREIVAAGYDNACAVKESLSGPGDDPYGIARVFTETSDDLGAYEHMLTHGHRPFSASESLKTKGWRYYRRAKALVS
jgi:peptidoglycan/xylan/chitin deacetylase (PgdA/CDA1 family)